MAKTIEIPASFKPDWLSALDSRTVLARELRDRRNRLCNDLGGADALSYQQTALVDRALFLELHLQQEESKLTTGGEFDSGKWVQACNSLAGIFAKLGLERRAREVPSLAEYLKAKETGGR